MRHKWKEPLFAVAFLLAAALLLLLAGRALRPVRVDYGAVWGPYLAEPRDSLDYLYLGSSYAYCDVNPGVVYGETGLTGYVLAGPEQTMSITYYYLKEALKTQSPAAVFLETSALHFDQYQNYTQVNVGYMPTSPNKLAAILNASEEKLHTGLFFDLYFYHSRWKDVTGSEVRRALMPVGTDSLKGFTAVEGVFEQIKDGPFTRAEKGGDVYEENLVWVERIADLCREEGVVLFLTAHPTYSQLTQSGYAKITADAAQLGLPFLNWSNDFAEQGIDPAAHFYDPGHLNRAGAHNFSQWLGGYMRDGLDLTPRPQNTENAASWQATAEQWAGL